MCTEGARFSRLVFETTEIELVTRGISAKTGCINPKATRGIATVS